MRPVPVNPHHVKKSKELDDNNPTKNDRKDPKDIAGLINAEHYFPHEFGWFSTVPKGIDWEGLEKLMQTDEYMPYRLRIL